MYTPPRYLAGGPERVQIDVEQLRRLGPPAEVKLGEPELRGGVPHGQLREGGIQVRAGGGPVCVKHDQPRLVRRPCSRRRGALRASP